jgi:hypothetical protein
MQYQEAMLKAVIDAVKNNNMTVRQASEEYGVPRSTIQAVIHYSSVVGPKLFFRIRFRILIPFSSEFCIRIPF